MSRQPLLILVICFILGIFFQDQFSLNDSSIYAIIGCCLLILILNFFQSYFLHRLRPVCSGLLFFGLGIILHFFNSFSNENFPASSKETILFKISRKLNSNEKNKKYEIVFQVGKENSNAILYIPVKHKELDFNHYYKTLAYITLPKSPQHDFQFDYAGYLKRKNIHYQCYANDSVFSAVRNDLSLNEKILQKRLDVLQSIDRAEMSVQTKEFLKGIILADRTETDAQTVKDFNVSGLVHFLAISGTHIVVIFGLFYFLLTRFLPLRYRKYAIISSLGFIWLFAIFIGFGNSVLRSCIMLTVYFIYVLLQRKPDVLHSLALSGFIILIFDTQQVFEVGFQLSFVAVLGIFWLNQPILRYFPKQDHYLKKLIFNTASISVSAQLATLPLVLYYFHQFSFVSIIANLVIVPFSEIIIVFSFLMTALIAFDLDFRFLSMIYDFIIRILLKCIHWFAGFDRVFFENIAMNMVEVGCLFVVLYLLRFAVLKFDTKNSIRLILGLLVFSILRTGFDFIETREMEFLVHNFNRHKIFSVKKGVNACFWIEHSSDKEKIIRYIVNPYHSSRRLHHTEIKIFPASAQKVVYNGKIYNIK
ncbi:ComEC/Rec2 family competence protein [Chryseobacterium populi]|uniref:ComEC/Rec2-related protein n=1 Tax=Chryseobacterium populi TaxID=1144316 RepID=J2SRE5_9FLAO|nr:ComEC/Rec2 family competence protein [Chryseobacterium populi]EJL68112.1 ComEC/Rec2-related protein [Chryseobacterium populi]